MQIRHLTLADKDQLRHTLNAAFADYITPFQLNEEQFAFKLHAESVSLEHSVGVFIADELVAFMLHGLRTQAGKQIVYNSGTGVLPAYRGQGLVGKMYAYTLPIMQEQGIAAMQLEVLEENSSAIRAYEKNGFQIRRKLLCFAGSAQNEQPKGAAEIRSLADYTQQPLQSFWDVQPSWQSSMQSMDIVQPKALGAFINDQLIGYILYNPTYKRMYQLAVASTHRRQGIASQLLAALSQELPGATIALNNIDEAALDLKLCLEKNGYTNRINQFEMSKTL